MSTQTENSLELNKAPDRNKRLRRLIMLVLIVSVGLHILAGVVAGIWVVARYLAKPAPMVVLQKQDVVMKPEVREHHRTMEEVAEARPVPVYSNRITSLKPSPLMLPDLPKVKNDINVPMDVARSVATATGAGGNGIGDGGNGGGGFFGGAGTAGSGLLEGRLYDLKQRRDRSPTRLTTKEYASVAGRVGRSAGSVSSLSQYYVSPTTLYSPRLFIPKMLAAAAPKAFGVEKEVQPQLWMAVYKGRVIAPDSGRYQFTGFGDDLLAVFINSRPVLDGGLLTITSLPKGTSVPFTVKKGEAYDMTVMIGECPGQSFSAWLQIEKLGDGSGPYWFRMTDAPVRARHIDGRDDWPKKGQHVHAVDAQGPPWLPAPMERSSNAGL